MIRKQIGHRFGEEQDIPQTIQSTDMNKLALIFVLCVSAHVHLASGCVSLEKSDSPFITDACRSNPNSFGFGISLDPSDWIVEANGRDYTIGDNECMADEMGDLIGDVSQAMAEAQPPLDELARIMSPYAMVMANVVIAVDSVANIIKCINEARESAEAVEDSGSLVSSNGERTKLIKAKLTEAIAAISSAISVVAIITTQAGDGSYGAAQAAILAKVLSNTKTLTKALCILADRISQNLYC